MLLFRYKPHDIFDARAVVPAAVKDDDFASRGKVSKIALRKELRLFTVGRCRKRDNAKNARAYSLDQSLDGAAFPRGVTTLQI